MVGRTTEPKKGHLQRILSFQNTMILTDFKIENVSLLWFHNGLPQMHLH